MTNQQVTRRRGVSRARPTPEALAAIFGLSSEMVASILVRPPSETEMLFAIAQILQGSKRDTDASDATAAHDLCGLLSLYATMDATQRASLLAAAQRIARCHADPAP